MVFCGKKFSAKCGKNFEVYHTTPTLAFMLDDVAENSGLSKNEIKDFFAFSADYLPSSTFSPTHQRKSRKKYPKRKIILQIDNVFCSVVKNLMGSLLLQLVTLTMTMYLEWRHMRLV